MFKSSVHRGGTFQRRCGSRCGRLARFGVLAFLGALSSQAHGAPSDIVFVSRDFDAAPDPARRTRAFEKAASGRLLVLGRDDQVRVLVDASSGDAPPGAPIDVMDPDVSFDGGQIVFAGYSRAEAAWRIYIIGADGGGLRQVTTSDRAIDLSRYGEASRLLADYDDGDPCFLPDGRICFVSTRYPGVAPDGRLRSTNLYVVHADGSDLHRITTERFGGDTPAVEPATGRIVYSRWWRTAQVEVTGETPQPIPPGSPDYAGFVLDESALVLRGIRFDEFPGVNSWFLAGIDPDGTDLAMFSGAALDRELTQAYRPSFLADGEVVALFIPQTPFIGYPRGNGLRRLREGPGAPVALGGPQVFPSEEVDPAPEEFLYASAVALPSGGLLVAAATAAARDYGIYVQDNAAARPELLYNRPGSAELDAVVLEPRPVPPVIADEEFEPMVDEAPRNAAEAFAQGGKFTFSVENLNANAPIDVALPNAVPIGQKLAIEFYMAPQRTSVTASDAPILIERREIPPDGRVEIELPAGVPLFEVLRRSDESIPLGRDGQIFHVGGMNFGRPGVTSRCVGCHAGHTQMAVPEEPAWTNVAPSAFVIASSARAVNGRSPAESPFRAVHAVDRRTDRVWASNERTSASLDLLWSTTIRAEEVVVYAPRQAGGGDRQVVRAFEVTTLFKREPQQSLRVGEEVRTGGTHVPLDPELDFDRLILWIDAADVSGLFEGQSAPAIAEVEVIARVTGEPHFSFVRGDVNCDGAVNISDAVTTLNRLFAGGPGLCCQAAADVNADFSLNITDPIAMLSFLFRGQRNLAPLGVCEPTADVGGLTCDSICP